MIPLELVTFTHAEAAAFLGYQHTSMKVLYCTGAIPSVKLENGHAAVEPSVLRERKPITRPIGKRRRHP